MSRPLFLLLLAPQLCASQGGNVSSGRLPSRPAMNVSPESAPLPAAPPAAASARDILERADLASYHGFIKYLRFRAEHAGERYGRDSDPAREDVARLAEWTRRILDNPHILAELRGVHEWAYESPVDGSGQPFKVNIPTDYDPRKPAPMSLYMHGYSGNHLEHATGMQDHPGFFEVSVLGRSRGGRYRALSEADVLHVIDYIAKHWAVDLDRVHITGGSMGGRGTFWLGSRYPHRFASGRPVCGAASDTPVGNLLTLPIYATHSDDDWTVPILHSRGPLARLLEMGGQVVYDETTGYGHAVWDYKEGNARAEAWSAKQVRPNSRQVKRLDITALDGTAPRAWWAEIAEWGPEPEPAHFDLRVEANNVLRARLDNITRLELRLSESPLERSLPLRLVIDGASPIELPAPLPPSILLVRRGGGWGWEKEPPPASPRLHTPGGANQLYNGEPLLIVYGTRGDAVLRQALRSAAEVASRNSAADWESPQGGMGLDGVFHNYNLYGELNVKADIDVTQEEIARSHLVLIGTASQNSLVERIASRLPVTYGERAIVFSDGIEIGASGNALGLVYYNPEAPSRLLFWIASRGPATYAADSFIPQLLGSSLAGADCIVARAAEPTLVVARAFDSRWRWRARDHSPLLPASITSRAQLDRVLAEAVRRATSAAFSVSGMRIGRGTSSAIASAPYVAGTTRLSDIRSLFYYEPVGVLVATGAELLQVEQALSKGASVRLHPTVDRAKIQRDQSYTVALSADQIWPFVGITHFAPRTYRVTDVTVADALERFGISE